MSHFANYLMNMSIKCTFWLIWFISCLFYTALHQNWFLLRFAAHTSGVRDGDSVAPTKVRRQNITQILHCFWTPLYPFFDPVMMNR